MTDRYFPNNFSDYHGENYFNSQNELIPQISSSFIHWIEHKTNKLDRHSEHSDGSVYTGSAGVALLYLRLALIFPTDRNKYKEKAKLYIDDALEQIAGKRFTFLCGDAGPLAIAAVVYNDLGDEKVVKKCIEKILALKKKALSDSEPDEYLYGRAGYLYALMFVRREISPDLIADEHITDVFQSMIKSGENYAKKSNSQSPLMYQWHEKEYMGAAHGVSGILYLLLKISQDPSFPHLRCYFYTHLIPTVNFLKSKKLPSGNYFSSSDSNNDRLVQWCHGAPGFVYLFSRAYELTVDREYLDLATAAGDVVWERGLLRKGYGLCHGTAGNGYVFLDLYRITNDVKWLHRAIKFAEHCLHYGEHDVSRSPDHPYSLFEGLAGTIYFMADILNPLRAQFPAFQ